MIYRELDKLKPYCVVKDSSDKTFLCGDIIWVSQNSDINNVNANGWITPSEELDKTLDFEAKNAEDYEVVNIRGSEICRKILQ